MPMYQQPTSGKGKKILLLVVVLLFVLGIIMFSMRKETKEKEKSRMSLGAVSDNEKAKQKLGTSDKKYIIPEYTSYWDADCTDMRELEGYSKIITRDTGKTLIKTTGCDYNDKLSAKDAEDTVCHKKYGTDWQYASLTADPCGEGFKIVNAGASLIGGMFGWLGADPPRHMAVKCKKASSETGSMAIERPTASGCHIYSPFDCGGGTTNALELALQAAGANATENRSASDFTGLNLVKNKWVKVPGITSEGSCAAKAAQLEAECFSIHDGDYIKHRFNLDPNNDVSKKCFDYDMAADYKVSSNLHGSECKWKST